MTTEEENDLKSKEIVRLRKVCRTKDEAINKAIKRIKEINLLLPANIIKENQNCIEDLQTYLG